MLAEICGIEVVWEIKMFIPNRKVYEPSDHSLISTGSRGPHHPIALMD